MFSAGFVVAGILSAFGDRQEVARPLHDAKLFSVHVLSQAKNFERRRAIRSTWASRVQTTFYVGLSADHAVNSGFFYEHASKLGLRIDAIVDEFTLLDKLPFYQPARYRYTVFATKVGK